MKRKMNVFLAGLLCLSCLTAPLSASAKILSEECVDTSSENATVFDVDLASDLFQYTGHYSRWTTGSVQFQLYGGYLETDLTNANCVVTSITCQDGSPYIYHLNGLATGFSGCIMDFSAEKVEARIGGRTLQVGDLLYIDFSTVGKLDLMVPIIRLDPTIHDVEKLQTIIEYAGNGYDLFGEDFNKIMRYELHCRPGSATISDYNDLPIEKGEVNNDDEINLLDVVSVNKNLMIGADIGFYGQIAADVNKDGQITPTDSLGILKYCVGLIDSFEELQ